MNVELCMALIEREVDTTNAFLDGVTLDEMEAALDLVEDSGYEFGVARLGCGETKLGESFLLSIVSRASKRRLRTDEGDERLMAVRERVRELIYR